MPTTTMCPSPGSPIEMIPSLNPGTTNSMGFQSHFHLIQRNNKNDIENFWSIYVLKSVRFHVLHFREPLNRAKNLMMTKNLVTKKW